MKRALSAAIAVLLLAVAPASATWSVVIVNRVTGEVALGQATCIVGPDLQEELAVVVPGVGGACVQAWWDFDGQRRELIWAELHNGTDPRDIVVLLNTLPNALSYQFGIVDRYAGATFTGSGAQPWDGGVQGTVGDLSYAIQGNVLAGAAVVLEAEAALLSEPGDMADKLVAAMLAAAMTGGDGRCSCNHSQPDSCGAPPPGFDLRFDKSAHTGFMLLSRVGDSVGVCDSTVGCANGNYYMSFNTTGQNGLPDPIVELRQEFIVWRATLHGRPDQLLSLKAAAPPEVPGDGQSLSVLRVRLRDWKGVPVGHGGAALSVEHHPDSAGLATIGPVFDHGDGSYSLRLTAGSDVGTDVFDVWVDDGAGPVLLYPRPTLVQTELGGAMCAPPRLGGAGLDCLPFE